MHDFHLKMIKLMMLILLLSVIIIMINGMAILKGSYYWKVRYFDMQLKYLEARIDFFQYQNGNIFNWIGYRQGNNQNFKNEKTNSIPILLYHGIIDNPKWNPDDVNIRFSDFKNHMFALKNAGYQTISMEDYLAFIKGKKELPKKSFLLTFDDGRKDSFYNGDPVLRTVGYTAVMHVITGRSLGKNNMNGTFHASEMELKKMIESKRWEMASHGKDDHDYQIIAPEGTKGRFLSNKLWLSEQNRLETNEEYLFRIKNDLEGSKLDIEKKLGVKVLAFAYPFGDFSQSSTNYPGSSDVLKTEVESIYPISFYQSDSSEFPTNYDYSFSPLARRMNISSETNASELLNMLDHIQDKPENYSDDFFRNEGWMRGWGLISIKDNALSISSTQTEDSSLTFLGGSYLWKDYNLRFNARLENGNAFTVAGRYRDGRNFAACNFYNDRITITQKVGGIELSEFEVPVKTNIASGKQLPVGLSIKGNKMECLLNNTPMLSGFLDRNLNYGGIGFNVWETAGKGVKLSIRNLKVTKNN